MFVNGGHSSEVGTSIPFRANTELRIANAVRVEVDSIIFDVVLYDKVIARLYSDGSVRLWAHDHETNTTKNRMNDVLIPIGWKLRSLGGTWKVFPQNGGGARDFVEAMLLPSNLNN